MPRDNTTDRLKEAFDGLLIAIRDLRFAKDMNHCAEKKMIVENVRHEIDRAKEILDSL